MFPCMLRLLSAFSERFAAESPEPLDVGGQGGLDAALLLVVAVAGRAAESGGGWQDPCDRGSLSGHVPVPHGGLHQRLRRPLA